MTKETIEEIEEYPTLYKEAMKQLIEKTSEEFVKRYLYKCHSLLSKWYSTTGYEENPCISYFSWCPEVRRALDHYIATQDADPTKTQLMKVSTVPLLYLRKYGEKLIKRIQRECGVTRWTKSCDNVLEFLDKHNLTFRDVIFEKHWGGWSGGGAKYYEVVVAVARWGRHTRYLYIVTKERDPNWSKGRQKGGSK